MYSKLYKCLCKEKLLYSKQFGFQKGHSTDYAIAHLVDQIYKSFEKLEMHGVSTTNLAWFASY